MENQKNSNETTKDDPLKIQYANADNFNDRVALGRRFNTNKYGFSRWVFDHIHFPPQAKVLELGCGPAYLWKSNLDRLPDDASFLLTDFSEGMLEDAKRNLAMHSDLVDFAVVNAQQIPYPDSSFDIVIANHMLYHVPDRKKALSEIYRVLKSDGVLYATTIGKNNLKELRELFCDCFKIENYPNRSVADAFGLENGEEQLNQFFPHVELSKFDNALKATEARPMIDYILSARGVSRNTEFLTADRIQRFENYLNQIINNKSYIHFTRESGLFIAKRLPEAGLCGEQKCSF